MMIWITTEMTLPPQGLKVLCHNGKGDFFVAQRLRNFWYELFKAKNALIECETPYQWTFFKFPPPYEGKMYAIVENKNYDMDDLDVTHPDVMDSLIDQLKDSMKKLNRHQLK